jgi:hypothetical protein
VSSHEFRIAKFSASCGYAARAAAEDRALRKTLLGIDLSGGKVPGIAWVCLATRKSYRETDALTFRMQEFCLYLARLNDFS